MKPRVSHISYDDFRVLREYLLHEGKAGIDGRMVPNTVFIDQQLASIRLNETADRDQRRAIRVARLLMSHVARAIEMGETRGFMKAIVDAQNSGILSCAILGIEGWRDHGHAADRDDGRCTIAIPARWRRFVTSRGNY